MLRIKFDLSIVTNDWFALIVQQERGYQTPSLRAEKETLRFRGARNFTHLPACEKMG